MCVQTLGEQAHSDLTSNLSLALKISRLLNEGKTEEALQNADIVIDGAAKGLHQSNSDSVEIKKIKSDIKVHRTKYRTSVDIPGNDVEKYISDFKVIEKEPVSAEDIRRRLDDLRNRLDKLEVQ